ncbi:MAG TPA: aldehyde dehydrogenase family protein, partial [Phycisphaeraceae bacterium]|nr:aldehyde dehydrogenase family protein [Phycisphaeraceae bacterium]
AVAALGLRVREYFPVGDMIPGMAYFVRRLLENTSNESWLRAGFADNAPIEVLLADPATARDKDEPDPGKELIEHGPERHALSPAIEGLADGRPFFNEPKRRFSRKETRESFSRTIQAVQLPQVPARATIQDAERATDAAAAAFPAWRDTEPMQRAKMLIDVADRLRSKRDELCGMMIKETGHTWLEADGEVCEAIDYCAYYARHAVALFREKRLGRFIGELNNVIYEPRGVAVIVGPWNHPVSILCSMISAAFVTGNTQIVCPAKQAAAVGNALVNIFREAGAPEGVVTFLSGGDPEVHAHLTRDPRVATIAYAGFADEALKIRRAAGEVSEQEQQVKEVICDLGGKNAIIIDTSADLDEAVRGVLTAAFGYQGQKYSSCSRVIVLRSRYEAFLDRLCGAMTTLRIGDPMLARTDIGPVIDEANYNRIREYTEIGKQEARLALALELPAGLPDGKYYIPPHIFADVRPEHRIAREVIFGPVLAVMPVSSFDEALETANSSPYRLTGGVYSRKPSNLNKARREFRVGNLYLNRTITGSAVGRQPFGGLGLSGVGAMTGGEQYLLNFVQPRTICENTMRRGFAPEL